ncbi:MAG: 23S rRNA (pseudouridine(1915)-N(3))-methyltransferase RlmH [Muribaculaceae bacterium]|jgi:23S rRNA (pseudouridine1915-N3)-methyltransferase|nr:23S rRNA (pseudouridine(1915)-N(3))-methyltransferase RlmH [Muribaculaceae bacterium]MEE1366685.1 23S rRNA (pseudouridine(1915)-N(3))-methyltransferase RlmH [Muribaculaceae bacterium]
MEISLIVIGKTNARYLQEGIDEYIKRLKHYIPYSITVLPDIKNTKKLTEEQQKEAEGKLMLDALKPGDCLVLLDERGKEFTSVAFADYLQRKMNAGLRRLVFVIGGPYGFSQSVYDRADEKISLSKMTFSHEMIRLFFTEQIYRAMTIQRGEPYHHQ